MASDQLVTAQIVLRALLEVQRRGQNVVLADLEKTEPDLAEFIMETLGQIHQRLGDAGATRNQTLRLQRQIESLVLVVVTALRSSHYELWKQGAAGTALAGLEADASGDAPPGDEPAPEHSPEPPEQSPDPPAA